MRHAGVWNARRVARAYVTRLGITAPGHIRIEPIAKRLGAMIGLNLRIVDAPLEGADSQLVRLPDEVIIIVSTRISDPASRKFVIAHELGHLVLDHPSLPPHKIGEAGPVGRILDDARDYEAEANAFASELTMPYTLIRGSCDAGPVNLDVAARIAKTFGMSILASAIRVAELSSERCAAVFSARRRVLWSAESAMFTIRIERDTPIGDGSVAARFWDHGAVDDRARRVPARAWFQTDAQLEIVEHAIASHEFGTVLSMLWVPRELAGPLGMVA